MAGKNKFYAELEVKEIEEKDGRYILHFVDEKVSVVRLSKKMYDISLTDEQSDATTLQRTQLQHVAQDLLAVMLLWDVKIEDVNSLIDLTVYSLNQNQKKAVDVLYGVPAEQRIMSDIDAVLTRKSDESEKEN